MQLCDIYGSQNTYLHNIICARFFITEMEIIYCAVRPVSSGTIRVNVSLQRVDIIFHAALAGESYENTKLILIHLSHKYAISDKLISVECKTET